MVLTMVRTRGNLTDLIARVSVSRVMPIELLLLQEDAMANSADEENRTRK